MAELLTIRQASSEAEVSIGYVNQLIKNGTLAGQKLGNQWVIDRPSFNAWLEKRRQKQEQKEQGALKHA